MSRALAAVLLLISLPPTPGAAQQAAPSRAEELWLSVRLTPGFSNYGAETVDAPGVQVESTVGNNNYIKANGTSQAAPLGALTASLLRVLVLDAVLDIIPATLPPRAPETCPG